MLKILYKGSKEEKEKLIAKLSEEAIFVDTEDKADIILIEINSQDNFTDLPLRFEKTTCFYLTSTDISIKKSLDFYNNIDILYNFYNKDMLLKKINTIIDNNKKPSNKKINITRFELIKKADNIPALPSTTFELIKLTENDLLSMKDIVEVIKVDQGLAAALIRLVNSPFYGFVGEITSIERASTILGLREIRKIAIAVSILPFYKKNFNLYGETGLKLWMHSYNVAKICSDVAKLENNIDEDAIYLAGLMHDIGKTILVDFLTDKVKDYEDEKRQTGFTHMEVGEIILSKWHVAKNVIDAVVTHHTRTDKLFNTILYLSNIVEKKSKTREDFLSVFSDYIKTDSNWPH